MSHLEGNGLRVALLRFFLLIIFDFIVLISQKSMLNYVVFFSASFSFVFVWQQIHFCFSIVCFSSRWGQGWPWCWVLLAGIGPDSAPQSVLMLLAGLQESNLPYLGHFCDGDRFLFMKFFV
jgi:hypothetical protein